MKILFTIFYLLLREVDLGHGLRRKDTENRETPEVKLKTVV